MSLNENQQPGQEGQANPPAEDGSGARLADFSIRFPVTICMIFVSLLTLGLISAGKIPLVLLPDVDQPALFVNVPYANATPAQVQESITKPLEEVLATIPGVKRLSSNSSSGSANVQLIFGFDLDLDMVRAEVREKIDQIRNELPEDVEQIYIRSFSTDDIPILVAVFSSPRDLRSSYDFLDLKLKKPLEQVPGVGEVSLFGVDRRRVDVLLRADDLRRHRVDVARLYRQLGDVSRNRSLGRVVDGDIRYGAVAQTEIRSIDAIRNYPVNDRGLRVSDVADVEFDTRPSASGRILNGHGAVGFELLKSSEANTVETVERVLAKLEEIQRDPAMEGIQVRIFHNSAKEITRSLSGLLEAGLIGALLAVLVLILFLRKLGATLAIALAIPFCIIAAVGLLYMTGYTLNTLTMMGLMLSAGMLVDNAVVVLESIYQKLEKGMDRVSAARTGTQEVLTAVIAATLTSVIIFVPIIFGEKNGFTVYFSNSGVAIIFALLASLFASLTLIPLAMARVLDIDVARRSRSQQWMLERLGPVFLRLRGKSSAAAAASSGSAVSLGPGRGPWTERYLRLVQWPLNHRALVGLVLVPALIAGSVWMLQNKVPDNTPEAMSSQSLCVYYEFSENFHYVKIREDYIAPIETFLLGAKERFKVRDVFSNYGNDYAHTDIYFDADHITAAEVAEIREQLKKELPVLPGAKIDPGQQQGENREWVNVNLYGDDPGTLLALAAEAKRKMLANPDFLEVHTAEDQGREEVQIELDRALARKYNISADTVSQFLGIVVRASQLGSFGTPQGEVEIWLQLQPEDLQDLNDLKGLVVGGGPDGEEILLSQVADFRLEKVQGRLQRESRRTYTGISASYAGEKKDQGQAEVTKVMNSLPLPPDYGWSFGFWTLEAQEQDQTFAFNLFLALFMVYFVMASLFESLAHPFAIILSLPFAAVGVTWFLYFTNTPFNMMSMIGMLVLVGVVVNNGIVLIDHINNLRRKGFARRQAILEGCRERLRPILMTASTTIVGLIPLAWGDSGLFEMRYFPMARTIMGGLMASTVLTLIVLPTYYSLFDDLAAWLKRTWIESDPSRLREPSDAPVSGD